MARFEELDKARRLLNLEELASLEEIKQAYKNKAFLDHPDKSGNENAPSEKMMKSLNQSHKLLMEYCSRYKYSFKEEDVDKAYSMTPTSEDIFMAGLKACKNKGERCQIP